MPRKWTLTPFFLRKWTLTPFFLTFFTPFFQVSVCLFLALAVWTSCAYADETPLDNKSMQDIDAAVERFERFVFRDGQDIVEGMIEKKIIRYSMLGYMGSDSGFSTTMFAQLTLHPVIGNMKLIYFNGPPQPSDIVAYFSDMRPNDEAINRMMRLISLGQAADFSYETYPVFDGICFASRIYVSGRLERTLVTVNVERAGTLTGPAASILPGACLAVGIHSHIGLLNVGKLAPQDIIFIANPNTGLRGVTSLLSAAQDQLYNSGISNGTSRSEARQRVREYLIVKVRQYQEWERKHNGR
jgi:hypothetical protein